ncbi:MAG: CBS domain-containing protein [Gaiellaceae bacterium]
MKVEQIMSSPVVTVSPDTPLRQVAALMAERGISGVPVVEGDTVVGVVSESDIVRREGTVGGVEATTAAEAMSAPAVTVEPWLSAFGAAALMAWHDVNRLPVVSRGRLVGIVARADLVRLFARGDAEIEREIREEVLPSLSLSSNDVSVRVTRGEVTLWGDVDSPRDLESLPRAVQRVTGVVRVHSRLRSPALERL